MSETAFPKHLHDRATRGDKLSVDEQRVLAESYARLDAEEANLLSGAPAVTEDDPHLAIEAALGRLNATTEEIRRLSLENEALRIEIVALQDRLARQGAIQPA